MSATAVRTSDRVVVPWLLAGLLLLGGGGYVGLHGFTSQRIPRGTTVEGIRIGGLLPGRAEHKLSAGLGSRAAEPITLGAGGRRLMLRPSAAGLAVDVAATVAGTRDRVDWRPSSQWDWFAGGRHGSAVVAVDGQRLSQAVAVFARQVDVPAVQGGVSFSDGTATAQYPVRGIRLDRASAASEIRRSFLHTGPRSVVVLRTRPVVSAVSAVEVSRAMDSFANPATSAPVWVRLDGASLRLDPEDFTRALSMRAVGPQLVPSLDSGALLAPLRSRLAALDRAPRDATLRLVDGRPRVVPARAGRRFDPAAVVAGFLPALTSPTRSLVVRSVPLAPRVTTADLRRRMATQPVAPQPGGTQPAAAARPTTGQPPAATAGQRP